MTTEITKNIPSADDDICIICYDPLDIEAGRVITKCKHEYCKKCYDELMNFDNRCAMCRTELYAKETIMNDTITESTTDRNEADFYYELAERNRSRLTAMFNTRGGVTERRLGVINLDTSREEALVREEEFRNGRTGGHWGTPTNPEGEEEILLEV